MTNPSFNDDSVEVENETIESQEVVTDEVVQAPDTSEAIQGDSGFANIVFDMSPGEETVTPEENISDEQGATGDVLDLI